MLYRVTDQVVTRRPRHGRSLLMRHVRCRIAATAFGGKSVKLSTPRKAQPRRTAFEAAGKVGLIGCFDGPRDLVQNRKKYLRAAARAKRPA